MEEHIMTNVLEREEKGITIYTPEGRIDTQGAVDLDLALQSAVAEGKHKMILDLSRVNYISSAGLRTLADVLTRNTKEGGDLKLVALTPRVLRVLQIIGFHNFFRIYDTIEAAVAAYQGADA
jgi:anti-anti-sigma factor